MKSIKRSDHNFVYKGEHERDGEVVNPGVADLSCRREKPGVVVSHWKPSEAELELLNRGGHVEVLVVGEPIPPMAINAVEGEHETPPARTDPGSQAKSRIKPPV